MYYNAEQGRIGSKQGNAAIKVQMLLFFSVTEKFLFRIVLLLNHV